MARGARRRARSIRRRLASAALAVAIVACAGRESDSGGTAAAAVETPTVAASASRDAEVAAAAAPDAGEPPGDDAPIAVEAPAPAPPPPDRLVAYDLIAELPTVEVAAPALRLDFGSGRTVGATLGRWRTGWGRDGEDDGRSVTVARQSPVRLYLPADAIRGTTMRVIVRNLGGRRITAEAGGERLGDANGSTSSYAAAEFPVPEALTGQVTVKLTFRGSGRHPDLGRGVALVDRIDFLTPEQLGAEAAVAETGAEAEARPEATAGTETGSEATPDVEPLRVEPATGQEPAALRQAAGTTLRFHLYVPLEATLELTPTADGDGTATATVRAVPDVGGPVELLAAEVGGEGEPREIDLGPLAGRAIRLELAAGAEGGGVRWSGPRVTVIDRGRAGPPARTARNLVILLVDTLRADKLTRIEPTSEVRADNLERWATEGVSFARAWAQENWTKPSVATLLTGLYPSTHATQSERGVLPPEAKLLSETLSEQGFATACFIANGYVSDVFGFRRGWGLYRNYVRSGRPNRAQHVFDDVATWLRERSADERFFLYVHTIDPHVPYIPPREFVEMYDPEPYRGPVSARETSKQLERIKAGRMALTERDRRRLEALYDGEISYHDAHVTLLYETLAEAGVLDDTLVVVTADHGEEFFEHGSVGHGHSLYEELLHVPLFLRLPEALPTERRVEAPVGLVDVSPTALELLGLPVPPEMQGRSLLPLTSGSTTGAEVVFAEFLEGQRAATGERYKIIQRGYRSMLYDLRDDPEESLDVAGEAPIALRTMLVRLARYLEWQEHEGREELRPRPEPEAQVDGELEAQLRALGYLGGPD